MGRGLLAVLLRRSFRRRSSTLPASAALRLVYGQPVPERPGVAGLAHSRSDGFEPAKSPWGTAWVFAAAGLMAFSTSARVTASPLLEKEEATVNGSIANGNHGSTANGHHGSIANGHQGSIANGNHGLIANGNHGLNLLAARKPRVVFVLGGPGSGKGTQCAKVVENYGFEHLSAGDLLRAEINSGSENGTMIQNMIKEGKIVPSEVTVKLIQKAMEQSKTDKFLIDGFPRNEENRAAFESVTGIAPEFILFFDCPEDEMERRLLQRNQGRVDDNIETIRKRFKVFVESSLPVVEYYESIGKVRKINATRSVEEIFNSIQPLFKPFVQDDLLQASQRLLDGIDRGDYEVYSLLCDPQLTAFEPESKGQLVEGLPFHKYYFDQKAGELEAGPRNVAQSTICAPKITTIGNVGLVTYTRLVQKEGKTQSFNETRVWERRKNSEGVWEWRNIHFHRSSGTVV